MLARNQALPSAGAENAPRGTPGEMVELIDWDEFVKYLDELRAARLLVDIPGA